MRESVLSTLSAGMEWHIGTGAMTLLLRTIRASQRCLNARQVTDITLHGLHTFHGSPVEANEFVVTTQDWVSQQCCSEPTVQASALTEFTHTHNCRQAVSLPAA